MEDLLIVPCIAFAMVLMYAVADLVGLAMGLGWRHYSKKHRQRKLEEKERVETFK